MVGRIDMLLKALVILLVFSSSSGFHWGRTASSENPVLNRKQRAALMRWLPLYTWKYFRYDPWMLRHHGLWVHDLSRNKNVKLAAYKRRTMLAKEQRMAPFVNKLLKFIRKNKSDAANELFKPKYLPISKTRWVQKSDPIFHNFRIAPPLPFSPRHWPTNNMRENKATTKNGVKLGFGVSEFQNIADTNSDLHRYWNPPRIGGVSFAQRVPIASREMSESLSVGFDTANENIHNHLHVAPADFSGSFSGVDLRDNNRIKDSNSALINNRPPAAHYQTKDDSISDPHTMENVDSYTEANNKSVQIKGPMIPTIQDDLHKYNTNNQKEIDPPGSFDDDGFGFGSWGPAVEHEHGFHVGSPSPVISISDISGSPEHQPPAHLQGAFQENTFTEGRFDEDTSNCEGIGLRRCNDDSECSCYGLYTCTDGRCSAKSTQGSDDMFGGFWHEGPVDIK